MSIVASRACNGTALTARVKRSTLRVSEPRRSGATVRNRSNYTEYELTRKALTLKTRGNRYFDLLHAFPQFRRLCAAIAIAANCTFAAESPGIHRFELNGAGTLVLDSPLQRSGTLRLQAALSPTSVTVEAQPVQSGARFALTAILAASSLVCYSDTIFRDDFDGDGF